MRIIAQNTLTAFAAIKPDAAAAIFHWTAVTKAARWASINEVQATFANAKALNAERVRFEIAGGKYRLIVTFKFRSQIAFIKFIETHAEYDKVDAFTVSRY